MNSAILTCTCRHENQDRMYGKYRRVCNLCRGKQASSDTTIRFRCTVCGSIITPSGNELKRFQTILKEKEKGK